MSQAQSLSCGQVIFTYFAWGAALEIGKLGVKQNLSTLLLLLRLKIVFTVLNIKAACFGLY